MTGPRDWGSDTRQRAGRTQARDLRDTDPRPLRFACTPPLTVGTPPRHQQGKQPTELEEYLTQLFANADQNESGVLGVHELRDLLRSADFGLTRLQIHTILAEAEYDESGLADYIKFAPVAAKIIYGMLDVETQLERHAAIQMLTEDFTCAATRAVTSRYATPAPHGALAAAAPTRTAARVIPFLPPLTPLAPLAAQLQRQDGGRDLFCAHGRLHGRRRRRCRRAALPDDAIVPREQRHRPQPEGGHGASLGPD